MFDLFRSREKTTRYLLGALLVLVALSMVITLIPGFGDMSAGASGPNVADICGKPVTAREVQVNLQQTLQQGQIPPDLIPVYVPQIVDQMVTDRAMSCYAEEAGIKVSDADVAKMIQTTLPQLFQDGKFAGKETYAQFLASNNMSIPEFENKVRSSALLRRLAGPVLDAMVVTPTEVENEFKKRNEKVTLDALVITPAKLQGEINISDADIAAHYNARKGEFNSPEKRSFQLLVIDEQKAAEGLTANEDDLRRYYDQNRDQFRTPERSNARHILIKTQGKSKEETEQLRKKAEDVLKQARGGADFAGLAKKYSEDHGSASRGGSVDWVTRGQMVPEFEKACFSLKPKEISDIVTTTYGFHIVQVMAREDARLRPFEEVKDQIQKDRQKEQLYDRMTQLGDQARAALTKDPTQGEAIAKQLNINFANVDKAARGSALPLLGAAEELVNAVFDLSAKGGVTDVIQVQGNKLAIAALTDITAPRPSELAEVKEQIRVTLRMERGGKLIEQRAQEAFEKAKAMGGDLAKVAAAMGLEFKKVPEFTREGVAEGIGSAQYVEEAFRREPGGLIGPISANNNRYICKVTGRMPADMVKFQEQRQELLGKVRQRKTQERKDLFEEGILQYLQRKGKVKVNQDAIKRITDSYRNS